MKAKAAAMIFLFIGAICILSALAFDGVDFHIILKNGKIINGTGNPWFYADIGIKDGKIKTIGNLEDTKAEKILDASNLVISPGFIDIHDHSDGGIVKEPQANQKVKQGVTTVMVGNCGTCMAPLTEITKDMIKNREGIDPTWTSMGEYLDTLEKNGMAINLASLVGLGTLRGGVIGYESS